MSDNTMCCGKCFHNIAKISVQAGKDWLILCSARCKFPSHNLVSYDAPSINVLENLGFIITTEKDDDGQIFIKLIGQRDADGAIFFCKEDDHGL